MTNISDNFQINWNATEGEITGEGANVSYIAPNYPCEDSITANLIYEEGYNRTLSTEIEVIKEVTVTGQVSFANPTFLMNEDGTSNSDQQRYWDELYGDWNIRSNYNRLANVTNTTDDIQKKIPDYKENSCLIKFKAGISTSAISNLLSKYNLKVKSRQKQLVSAYSKKDINEKEVVNQLNKESIVEFAELINVFKMNLDFSPRIIDQQTYLNMSVDGEFKDGNVYSTLWDHRAIGMNYVWKYCQDLLNDLETVKVAVLDTGIDLDHPSLEDKLVIEEGKNYVLNDDFEVEEDKFDDDNGHGTFVAGVIGGKILEDGTGIRGIAQNVELVPIKIGNYCGMTGGDDLLMAAQYASEIGADIINMSLGHPSYCEREDEVFRNIVNNYGVIPVAASGNWGNSEFPEMRNVQHPAGYDTVIGVGNVSTDGTISESSSWGEKLDFATPGTRITSCWIDDNCPPNKVPEYHLEQYTTNSGTSASAPAVCGIVALLLGQDPTMSFDEVYNTIKEYTVDLGDEGKDDYFGWGLPNVYRMLTETKIDQTKLFIGREEDGEIIQSSKLYSVNGNTFSLTEEVVGDSKLYAWIDVNNSGDIDEGDYLKETDDFTDDIEFKLKVHEK